MIVVHLVDTLYGGVARVAANLINYQLKNNIKPIVAYCNYDSAFENYIDEKIELIEVKKMNFIGGSMLFGMQVNKLYKILRSKYPNEKIIIHGHNVQTIGLLSNISKIPLICTLHSMTGVDNNIRIKVSNYLYKLILRNLERNNKIVCAVSKSLINDFGCYLKKGKINLVYNGVETVDVMHKRTHDVFNIAHIGNVSIAKGWDKLFETIKIINRDKKLKDIKIHIAGKIIDLDEKDILFKIEQMSENVIYHGFVNNVVDELLSTVDVLILASQNEGTPMVVLEAMAYGIPCLVTKVGGMKEIVKEGYNGFYVENAKDIVKYILFLRNNDEDYNRISVNTKKYFDNNFTSEIMNSKYYKYYKQLLK